MTDETKALAHAFRWVFYQLEGLRHCFRAMEVAFSQSLPESLDTTNNGADATGIAYSEAN